MAGWGAEAAVVVLPGGEEDAFGGAELATEMGEGVEGAAEEGAVAADPEEGVSGGEHPAGEGVDVVDDVGVVGGEEDVPGGEAGEGGVVREFVGGGGSAKEGMAEDGFGEADEAASVEAEGGVVAGGAGLAGGGAGPGGLAGVGAVGGEAGGGGRGHQRVLRPLAMWRARKMLR